ncbi:MAG TPA: HAMP domain-containing sensor histidine kinase [Clostridiaceae bacterium]|nr:HAMP domain-containing sensor histidine kinase [Clostridiaceae bacterium]
MKKLEIGKIKLSTKITWNYAIIFTSILLIINFAVYLSTQLYNRAAGGAEITGLEDTVMERLATEGTAEPEYLRRIGVVPPFYAEISMGDSLVRSLETFSLTEADGRMTLMKHTAEGTETTRNILYEVRQLDRQGIFYRVVILKDLSVYSFMNTVNLVTLIIASLFGIVASFVVGYYLSKQSFDPILKMTKSASAIGPNNVHDRVLLPEATDELRELGETFNSLLDRLDVAYTNQAKFVSDASHELRTPLTIIKGYTDMLKRWGKDDPEILEESIEAIKSESENMALLVENLLFIAKGENKKLKINPQSFNVKELLEEIDKEGDFNGKGRDILVESESFRMTADRKMIKQLIRIFLDNSIKFTEKDAKIVLKAIRDGEKCRLYVIDYGKGIPKEDLDRIIESVYVADKERTKDKAGSGLGLSIAKWIVETHGGVIRVESTVGQGTTMEVTLPLEPVTPKTVTS